MGKKEAIEQVKKYLDIIIPEFNPNMGVLLFMVIQKQDA